LLASFYLPLKKAFMPDLTQSGSADAKFDCNIFSRKALDPYQQQLMAEAPSPSNKSESLERFRRTYVACMNDVVDSLQLGNRRRSKVSVCVRDYPDLDLLFHFFILPREAKTSMIHMLSLS
jgi:hypothetical protein